MKKVLSIILAAVMMAAMCVSASAVHSSVTTAVFGTPEAIDGIKDAAWDGANSITANDLYPGIEDIGDEATSTTVWTMWDGEYFYFYAELKDMTIDCAKKDDFWNQDTCGAILCYDYSKADVEYNADATYLGLGEAGYAGYMTFGPTFDDPTYNTVTEAHANIFTENQKYVDQVKSYVVEIEGGWAVEARLPLSLYKEYAEGDKIGFEFLVNESLGMGTRSSFRGWNNSEEALGSNTWTNPTCFGTLILGAAAASADDAEAPADDVAAADDVVVDAAPQTFDVAVIAAVASVLSLVGYAFTKKR